MSVIANRVKQSHSVIIKVDFREDNSNIEEILKKEYGVQTVKERLKVGAYVVNNTIVIERKTVLDFI